MPLATRTTQNTPAIPATEPSKAPCKVSEPERTEYTVYMEEQMTTPAIRNQSYSDRTLSFIFIKCFQNN